MTLVVVILLGLILLVLIGIYQQLSHLSHQVIQFQVAFDAAHDASESGEGD